MPHKDIWNAWHGCKKCSEGCRNCYMYFLDEKRGVQTPSSVCHKTGKFNYPISKSRDKQYKIKSGERLRVNMTSDTFLEDADAWREDFWKIIRTRSDVIFWILTKRPERFSTCLPSDWGDGYPNVSMNITCENQEMFDKRIGYLLSTPAKHKGLCLAPLLSDIDITPALASGQIEEVCVGGENYNNPRVCCYEWVKHIADTCAAYKINFCWYETGTLLSVNGAITCAPLKQTQSINAFFAGLNQHYYDPIYDLRYEDGTPVPTDALRERKFNLNHCLFCSNQDMCDGCTNCGGCGPTNIVSRAEFRQIQYDKLVDMYKDRKEP